MGGKKFFKKEVGGWVFILSLKFNQLKLRPWYVITSQNNTADLVGIYLANTRKGSCLLILFLCSILVPEKVEALPTPIGGGTLISRFMGVHAYAPQINEGYC